MGNGHECLLATYSPQLICQYEYIKVNNPSHIDIYMFVSWAGAEHFSAYHPPFVSINMQIILHPSHNADWAMYQSSPKRGPRTSTDCKRQMELINFLSNCFVFLLFHLGAQCVHRDTNTRTRADKSRLTWLVLEICAVFICSQGIIKQSMSSHKFDAAHVSVHFNLRICLETSLGNIWHGVIHLLLINTQGNVSNAPFN